MGYLNNSTVSVDAILTTKGRELLSKGTTNGLDIKYFALGDDEVDYDLWNPAHPLGSDYYGIIIENMPVLEASPIPEQNLKSKLITLNKGTTSIATVVTTPATIGTGPTISLSGLKYSVNGAPLTTPSFIDVTALLSDTSFNNNILGYTVNFDSRYFNIVPIAVPPPVSVPGTTEGAPAQPTNLTPSLTLGDAGTLSSIVTTGIFRITLKNPAPAEFLSNVAPGAGTLQYIYVTGNEIGGRATLPVYIGRGSF